MKSVEDLEPIRITKGQLLYEFEILKERLKHRAPQRYEELLGLEITERCPKPHPIFVVIEGEEEPWEKSYWRKDKVSSATREHK